MEQRLPYSTGISRLQLKKGDFKSHSKIWITARERMTPKTFTDTGGTAFPATTLDDRSGVETRRDWYKLAEPGEQVERLPVDTFAIVEAKAASAKDAMAANDFVRALDALEEALGALPEPKQQWNAAGWILVAIGECLFRQQRFKNAAMALQDSIICPGALGNPWVHLRLGQARFELNEMDRAADELTRAYMGGDREIFDDEDPKYFQMLQKVLRLPTEDELAES
jgi:tetratricopeptide (TPR) repeat protein